MTWLLETLIWTGLLVCIVLLLRRPVARYFGAKAAYALWALPAVRLVLPSIVLPAWMAPERAPAVAEPLPAANWDANSIEPLSPIAVTDPAAASSVAPSLLASIDWSQLVVAVWLTGAIAFVALRVRAYRRMRQLMLENAIDVGAIGAIRLIETPLTEAPIAFGVREKIVALPENFLDRTDREVRDLTLAHEIEHHSGHDLLVNFLVQPLFALHWFNPLAYLGWRAMRCDQEAACDARVVAQRTQHERARYGEIIASFATGPRLALAAPMACPVLGDKSIIHRLRSLNMTGPSRRRRNLGRVGFATAVLALPLTATISFAEAGIPEPPAPPAAPKAPAAPPPPLAPHAPIAWQAASEIEFEQAMEDVESIEAELEEAERVLEIDEAQLEHGEDRHVRHAKVHHRDGHRLTAEERARIRAEVKEAMAEAQVAMAHAKEAQRIALVEVRESLGGRTRVETKCESDDPVVHKVAPDGKKTMLVCETAIHAQALKGIKDARKAMAADKEMDPQLRAEVLQSLDEEIAKWDREG